MKKVLLYFALPICIILSGYCDNSDNSEDESCYGYGAVTFHVDFSKLTTLGYNITKLEVNMTHDWTFSAVTAELTIDPESDSANGDTNALCGNWSTSFYSYENDDTLIHWQMGPIVSVKIGGLYNVNFEINPEAGIFETETPK